MLARYVVRRMAGDKRFCKEPMRVKAIENAAKAAFGVSERVLQRAVQQYGMGTLIALRMDAADRGEPLPFEGNMPRFKKEWDKWAGENPETAFK